MRRASVRLDGEVVGLLSEREGGGTRFSYTDAWVARGGAPISLTMPTRAEPYDHPGIAPFFLNLLPEGWLLELSVSRLKLSRDDPFALLLSVCRDCVGAVEIFPDPPAHSDLPDGTGLPKGGVASDVQGPES